MDSAFLLTLLLPVAGKFRTFYMSLNTLIGNLHILKSYYTDFILRIVKFTQVWCVTAFLQLSYFYLIFFIIKVFSILKV